MKIPEKYNRNNAFLYGKFIDTDDMMETIMILQRMCIDLQRENEDLKERLGMPVSKFRY